MREGPPIAAFETTCDFLMAWLGRRPADMLAAVSTLRSLTLHDDPEFLFRVGWLLCDVREHEQGLAYLRRALSKSYCAARTLSTSPSFDPLRSEPLFQAILAEAEEGRRLTLAALRDAGGERLLGQGFGSVRHGR
jgi:hypothetical protein